MQADLHLQRRSISSDPINYLAKYPIESLGADVNMEFESIHPHGSMVDDRIYWSTNPEDRLDMNLQCFQTYNCGIPACSLFYERVPRWKDLIVDGPFVYSENDDYFYEGGEMHREYSWYKTVSQYQAHNGVINRFLFTWSDEAKMLTKDARDIEKDDEYHEVGSSKRKELVVTDPSFGGELTSGAQFKDEMNAIWASTSWDDDD